MTNQDDGLSTAGFKAAATIANDSSE